MAKRRPVIIDGNPHVLRSEAATAAQIFDRTGGNTGNLAFRFGTATSLANPVFMPFNAPVEAIGKAGDILVLPLANQLGPHTSLGSQAERLRAIDLPVIAVGLGAQAKSYNQDIELDAGTLAWVQEIARRAPADHANIGVRGPYTLQQLDRLGLGAAAKVTGCPSNFINSDPDLPNMLAARFKAVPKRIAVAAGIPYIATLAQIERELADIVTLTDGAYIVQHGLEMIQLANREFDLMGDKLELCRRYVAPQSTTEAFQAWCERFAWAIMDVPQWMEFVRRFDFVVGTRFHGAMLAIQAGVPAGCIAHDSRTLEMCETMGIPVCHYTDIKGPLTWYNVKDYFSFDPSIFQEKHNILQESYLAILNAADLPVARRLL